MAAPKTPAESPSSLRTMRVCTVSLKTQGASASMPRV
jgi:hypothetical protein